MIKVRLDIIGTIRKWVNRLFPKGIIEREMSVEIATSAKMEAAIKLWTEMYENTPPWADKDKYLCTNIPATIAEEMARLILTEFHIEVTGSSFAEFVDSELKRELACLDEHVESYCAKGGIVLKPYVMPDLLGNPAKIKVDFTDSDLFFPTAYDSNKEVISGIFIQNKRLGSYIYTRLEYHDFHESDSEVIVWNKAYRSEFLADESEVARIPLDKEVSLAEVPEWALFQEKTIIRDVKKPTFVYVKTCKANNVDASSPLGISIFARAVDLIKRADRLVGEIDWEFESKEAAIFASEEYLRHDEWGRPVLPEGKEKLFYALAEGTNTAQAVYDVYSPEIRESPLFSGLNKILKRIEWNVGFAYGTLSDPDLIEKTATEVLSSKQRSYRTVTRMQEAWGNAFNRLVEVIASLNGLYGNALAVPGNWEVNIQWGDSVLEDVNTEYQRRLQLVNANIMRKELLLAWYFGISEKEALEMMPNIEGFPEVE